MRRLEPGFGARWLYALAAMPVATDIIETGGLPHRPREWITEVCACALIIALVHMVRRHEAALAATSRTDTLTGLWNRRAFDELVEDECVRAHRSGQPLVLVYIDLDHFKRINDESGHDAGDRVLRQLADAIRAAVRDRVDRGFRLGGDEFALLLPGGTPVHAGAVMRRLEAHCAQADRAWVRGPLAISAGIVELAPGEQAGEFVRRADEAMFDRKRARRAGGAEQGPAR